MLSLRDLAAARDLYHLHLMAKQHVVGTALGRYLIRKSDPWPRGRTELTRRESAPLPAGGRKEPKRLDNAEVRRYSWPCILVFVDTWADEDDFGSAGVGIEELVPRALHLPNGSRVPVCVVHAPPSQEPPAPSFPRAFPKHVIGGGYPLLLEVQGAERFASIGCLVSDGHTVYALTNRHVAGAPGEVVYTLIGGEPVRVGVTSDRQLTRKAFEDVYPGWPGKSVYVNMDVGLITLDDTRRWTTQVYGVGRMGELADLSGDNISLRLIDADVRGYGAASGPLRGKLLGLFYRYKSVGGFEYVADFLIGPRESAAALPTRPGDSGTVWLLEPEGGGDPMPLALQWGGHRFATGEGATVSPYALATCLSAVCRQLDVEVVRDWNVGALDYWGAVGHYTIATRACAMVRDPDLKALMEANLERISFAAPQINRKTVAGLSKHDFVPLADVPDLVWKIGPFKRGGPRSPEHACHFANLDQPDSKGRTLLALCERDPANVDVAVWREFFTDAAVKDTAPGLLPFRVWQFHDAMVEFLKHGKVAEFVCAAGIVSHYVGDACQPLHVSYLFDGDPADIETVTAKDRHTGEPKRVERPRAAGVHSAYEGDMVNFNIQDILAILEQAEPEARSIAPGGHAAAVAVVALMSRTLAKVPPREIVKTFVEVKGQSPKRVAERLWEAFGEQTAQVIADGAALLAGLWESAWKEGARAATRKKPPAAVSEEELERLYRDPAFVPSTSLADLGPLLVASPE
jgi:hypothetical protein